MADFPQIDITRKEGTELFELEGKHIGINLLQFWQWSASDITGNAMRGLLAEFIVGLAVGSPRAVRAEWDAFDVLTDEGTKIEVKSAAYIQSWAQKKPSLIQFRIRPTREWDYANNEFSIEVKRQADIYVFCVLANQDQKTLNPLDLGQWEFYVLGTDKLNQLGPQKTISLSRLVKLNPVKTNFEGIKIAIRQELAACS
jgi:hypothetical protein